MEQIDVLFIAFVIFAVVASLYIAYLKAGVDFLTNMVAKHQVVIEELVKSMERQVIINEKQGEINSETVKALDKVINSSTGGVKQSN